MNNLPYQLLFQAIIEQSGEGIALIDNRGRYLLANPAFCQMVDYTEAELLRYTVYDFLPQGADFVPVPKILNEQGNVQETELRRRDGSWVPVELNSYAIQLDDQNLVLKVVRDMTAQKEAEQTRQAYQFFLDTMEKIDQLIFTAVDLDTMFNDVLEAMLAVFGSDRAWLLFPCNPQAETWYVPMEKTRSDYPGVLSTGTEVPTDDRIREIFRDALEAEDIVVYDLATMKRKGGEDEAGRFNVQSQIMLAIYPQIGQPWLLGMHQCSHDRVWTELDKQLFRDIGARIAGSLSSLLIWRDLEKSESRLRQVFLTSPDAFSITRLEDGLFVDVNQSFCEITGYSRVEVLGKLPQELNIWATMADRETFMQKIQEIGWVSNMEVPFRLKDGRFERGLISGRIIEFNGVPHLLSISKSIEALRQGEAKIAELAEFNENIVASAPVGIVTVNLQGKVTSANDAFLHMIGSPGLDAIINLGMDIPAVQEAGVAEAFNKVLTSGESFCLSQLPYTTCWGKQLMVDLKVVPQKSKDGRITGMIIVIDDVTAEARAEMVETAVYQIAQAADRAASLHELYPVIHEIIQIVMPADNFYIALHDEKADLIRFAYYADENEPATPSVRKLGKGLTEFVLRHGTPQLTNDDWLTEMIRLGEVDIVGQPAAVWLGVPLIVERKTIGVMAVQHYQDPKAFGEQEQLMLEYVASQVAQTINRKQKEQALRESEEIMRSLARLSQNLEQAHSYQEIVTFLHKEICTVLGYNGSWIYLFDEAQEFARLIASAGDIATKIEDKVILLKIRGDAFMEEIATGEHIVVVEDARTDPRTDKKKVSSLGNRTLINVPVHLEDNQLAVIATGSFGEEGVKIPSPVELDYLEAVARHVAVVIDRVNFLLENEKAKQALQVSNQQLQTALAELEETQSRMVQRERLAAVGQLAAGIAHDFNNIMGVIVLYMEMGLRFPDIPQKLRERMQIVLKQAWRASELVQQILDFSRSAVMTPRPINLVLFLQEQVKMLQRTLPENIRIKLVSEPGELQVNADATRLQQVVVNLVVNARDAMLHGGELKLAVGRSEGAGAMCAVCHEPILGEWVQLEVMDGGNGIPENILPHIFEPFFTTKEVGQGSGLGLSQVGGIVAQHGGHMTVESQAGLGTLFTIYLPPLAGDLEEERPLTNLAMPQGQGETILIVEDDGGTRVALAETVEALNYRVLTAVNGRTALTILEEAGDTIALVMSDLVMPEMGGLALLQTLRQRGWSQPFVVLTGHPLEGNLHALQAEGLTSWLLKPASSQKLAELLAKVLHVS